MSRAVIYTRVSTAEQVENFSLDTQERACRDYCEREGLEVDRLFREEGESAKTANRPQLQELLSYCAIEGKRRDLTHVVVYKVDRLARDTFDHLAIRASLDKSKIQLRAVVEIFDESPQGQFYEIMMAALAQLDNNMRAARTVAGMREGVERGRWLWKPPIGYRKGASHAELSLYPDPEIAPLVRRAFEQMASAHRTKREVLDEVTALGLKTDRGKSLTPQVFGNLLKNPIYTGRILLPKWDFDGPGDFEPIVSPELFTEVQLVLQGRKQSKAGRHLDHPDFPLRRVVRCSECETGLTGSWSRSRSGSRYGYYRCPRRGCGHISVRKERLESLLAAKLDSMSVRPEVFRLLRAVVEDSWREAQSNAVNVRRALEARRDQLAERKNKLVDALLDGRIDQATYEGRILHLSAEQGAVEEQIADCDPGRADPGPALAFAESLLADVSGCWNRLEWQHRPTFLRSLFPVGLVYDDDALGTGQNPWWLSVSARESVPLEGWAPPSQLDWNQVYEWLAGMDPLRRLIGTRPSSARSPRSRP